MNNNFDKKFNKNVVLNYVLRIIGLILGLLSTRINLSYLGATIYGLWATITSIASWINYGDFGIGNGLRNELAKAYAENDKEKQKKLISTAITVLSLLAVCLLCILFAVTEILFATHVMDVGLRVPMYITNAFFCLDLIFGVGRAVAYGFQRSWLTSLAQTGTSCFRILGVLLLIAVKSSPNLVLFSVVNGVGGVIGNLILVFILLFGICKNIRGNIISDFSKDFMKSILKLGVGFFVLQISCLVLDSTDNLIINYLYESEAVTKYSIITTVYTTGDTLYSIVLINLWSAVTYALAKSDFSWIKRTTKKLLIFWFIFSIGVVIVSICFNYIVKIWLGDSAIEYEWQMIFMFAVYLIVTSFGSIFVNITNGLGRLKPQLICSVIGMVLNIPLSVFFAKVCGLGLVGIKLATLCCRFGAIIVVPIDICVYLHKLSKQNGGGDFMKTEHYYSLALRERESADDYFFHHDDFRFTTININKSKRYWYADPFLYEKDGNVYIFFEAFDLVKRRGEIGYCLLDGQPILEPHIVISEPFHLSFPFIFEKDGDIYIMPETCDDRSVSLYKAIEFPDKWERSDTLIKDIFSCDSVFLNDGEYLLTSKMYGKPVDGHIPSCWVKNTLFKIKDNMEEEDGEIVIKGDYGVRNAGKIFRINDKMIRPGQNCLDGNYGKGLVFWEIDRLSPYCEKEIYSIDAEKMQDHILQSKKKDCKIVGVHTYNTSERYEIIDYSIDYKIKFGLSIKRFFKRINKFLRRVFK